MSKKSTELPCGLNDNNFYTLFEFIALLVIVVFSSSKAGEGKPCKSDSGGEGGACGCSEMPNKSVCWSDAQCAGGNCKGNSFLWLCPGLQRGKCATINIFSKYTIR